jgi:hypothetical protein
MTYDACNRLVKVVPTAAPTFVLYPCEYDGLNRRIVRTDDSMARHSYYNEGWQELEVRKETSPGTEDEKGTDEKEKEKGTFYFSTGFSSD